jgi:hypothetical protein
MTYSGNLLRYRCTHQVKDESLHRDDQRGEVRSTFFTNSVNTNASVFGKLPKIFLLDLRWQMPG